MDTQFSPEKQGRKQEVVPSPPSEPSSGQSEAQGSKEASRSTMLYREAQIIAENLKESGTRR
jgi:hypothetical protein